MEVNNKVAIVTGGIGGIGLTTVQHLLRNGAKYVGILDLAPANSQAVGESLEKLEQEFEKEKFGYYSCDVRNIAEFIDCYDKIAELNNYVDILVNNAATARDRDIDLIIDVNFKGLVKCVMTAIERMGKHKGNKGGVIVNIGSFLGLINAPTAPVYNATKHAVVSFVRSMKEHNKTFGVRIVCICPGMTKTNMIDFESLSNDIFDFVDVEKVKQALSVSPQEPDNVASAIVEIIKRGKEGDVWLAQNDEPPFAVGEEEDLEKLRIPF